MDDPRHVRFQPDYFGRTLSSGHRHGVSLLLLLSHSGHTASENGGPKEPPSPRQASSCGAVQAVHLRLINPSPTSCFHNRPTG